MNNPAYTRELARWYPLKPHPVQDALITDDVRFKIVPAGRRSGKTERAKRFVVKAAMMEQGAYFLAAPTRDQVKRIYWNDIKMLCFASVLGRRAISESELQIRFPNGSTISLIGLDQPQRIEGSFWSGGVIDEIADVREGAWQENISPALDTFDPRRPDYRPWCWLIGVPDGINHFYDMVEYAKLDKSGDWKVYHWYSSDILPEDVINAAKQRLSPRQFRQEYEASFESSSGRIYSDYGQANLTNSTIGQHEQIMWFHDFNYTPLSSGIGVRRGDALYILDEIILTSAISRQSAAEFVERFSGHQNKSVIIYGDPAGRAGEKHGHASDYTEMEQVLLSSGWKVERRVKAAAPSIKDRQNSVRAKICNAAGDVSLFVNPDMAKYAHKGLATVQTKSGSTFLEEDGEYQHITTAIGYCVDYEWPIRRDMKVDDFVPIPTTNYFGRVR